MDETSELMEAFGWLSQKAQMGVGVVLDFPPGVYRTSVSLEIRAKHVRAWQLRGLGDARIIQIRDDRPVLRLLCEPGGSWSDWKIENLALSFERIQEQENVRSICIAMGALGDTDTGFYDFTIERCRFENCFRGIAVDYDCFNLVQSSCPIWGFRIEDVSSYKSLSGATIWLDTRRAGSPRGKISNFYAQNENAKEPAIVVKGMSSLVGEGWEFNLGRGPNFYLENVDTFLTAVRFENARLDFDARSLGSFGGGQALVSNVYVQSCLVSERAPATIFQSYGCDLSVNNITVWGPSPVKGTDEGLTLAAVLRAGRVLGNGTVRYLNKTKFELLPKGSGHDDVQWGHVSVLSFAALSQEAGGNVFSCVTPFRCRLAGVSLVLDVASVGAEPSGRVVVERSLRSGPAKELSLRWNRAESALQMRTSPYVNPWTSSFGEPSLDPGDRLLLTCDQPHLIHGDPIALVLS